MHFERPITSVDAVLPIARPLPRAYILAGGTDLLVKMKSDGCDADVIVDITSIEEMRNIVTVQTGFRACVVKVCISLAVRICVKTIN